MVSGTLSTGLTPRTSTKTKTRLAPVSMQGLEVLALPVASLPDRIASMAESNPLLEINYEDDLFSYDALPSESAFEEAKERAEAKAYDVTGWSAPRHTLGIAGATEWDFSRIQDDCIETETLHEFLRLQVTDLHLSACDLGVMNALIDNVTDDGYFVGDVGMVAFECDVEYACAERLLGALQRLQPRGVGAHDVRECLKLQIPDDEPHPEVMSELIEGYLDDLAQGRLPAIARELGVSVDEVARMKRVVRGMNPRPGSAFYQRPDSRYVIPDIIVRRKGSDFTVEVVGASQNCLALNAEYVAMMEEEGLAREAAAYLSEKREEADSFLRNLEQRRQTLQRFGVFLVERQFKFFLTGGSALHMNLEEHLSQPTMQQAADALDIHVSTVSRAVQGKYIQTPWGTFPLKMFFTRAMPRVSSGMGLGAQATTGAVSSFEIKQMIKDLIAAEDKSHPLSDAKICAALNEKGIEIKRRTVAKYRSAIASSVVVRFVADARDVAGRWPNWGSPHRGNGGRRGRCTIRKVKLKRGEGSLRQVKSTKALFAPKSRVHGSAAERRA